MFTYLKKKKKIMCVTQGIKGVVTVLILKSKTINIKAR